MRWAHVHVPGARVHVFCPADKEALKGLLGSTLKGKLTHGTLCSLTCRQFRWEGWWAQHAGLEKPDTQMARCYTLRIVDPQKCRLNKWMHFRAKWKKGRSFTDHLLCSRLCVVRVTGLISFNHEVDSSNLPSVKKLLSGWDCSQPRLFLTPKTMLIKEKKIFQQPWECTSKRSHCRVHHWPKSSAALAEDSAVTFCTLTTVPTFTHTGHTPLVAPSQQRRVAGIITFSFSTKML